MPFRGIARRFQIDGFRLMHIQPNQTLRVRFRSNREVELNFGMEKAALFHESALRALAIYQGEQDKCLVN